MLKKKETNLMQPYGIVNQWIRTLGKRMVGYVMYLLYHRKALENKVVFSNFSGKCYGDSPKYISERLHEMMPNVSIVWLQNENYQWDAPCYVKKVKWRSKEMFRELMTAKVWINSHTFPVWAKKRKDQYYLNTWHGSFTLKKLEGDAEDKFDYMYRVNYRYNSSIVDTYISNSRWLSDIFRRAFGYRGKIVECGYPRSDVFFRDRMPYLNKVKKTFGLDDQTQILLYAPTFRNTADAQWLSLDFIKLRKALEKYSSQKWAILVRLHPVMKHLNGEFLGNKEGIADATTYPDIQELVMASDLLVSDYSSVLFDMALAGRPGLIYASDIDEYINERGFYFDLRDLPFPVADSTERLIDNIVSFDRVKYRTNLDNFMEKIGVKENGNATDYCVNLICEQLKIYQNDKSK